MSNSIARSGSRSATRRAVTALGLSALLTAAGLGLAVGISACGSESSDSTSGKRVLLHTRVEMNEIGTAEFLTDVGWNVTLTKAAVAAGPFYYFDGAPPLVLRQEPRNWQYAARFFGLSIAHAHPGHYQAGNAMGEMLESSSVDLLAGPVDFPDGDGVSGIYRSARFTFSAATGSQASELDGHVALAEGKAEKAGESARYFRAFADLAAIKRRISDARVEGCEFTEVDVEANGTVTLNVNPKIWFDLVDFTEAEPGSAEEPADLPVDSQPAIAFALGVTQLSAYKFSYSSP